MAEWNGGDLGHFPIEDLFSLDTAVADDITLILTWLGAHPGAVYANAFGRRGEMEQIIERWGALKAA